MVDGLNDVHTASGLWGLLQVPISPLRLHRLRRHPLLTACNWALAARISSVTFSLASLLDHLSPSRLPPSLILPAFSMARQKTLSPTHTCTHTHAHAHTHTHTHQSIAAVRAAAELQARATAEAQAEDMLVEAAEVQARASEIHAQAMDMQAQAAEILTRVRLCARARARPAIPGDWCCCLARAPCWTRATTSAVVGVRQEGARWCCDALPSAGRNDVQVRRGWYAHISLSLYAGRWRKCSFRCQQCKRKRRSRAMWQRERKLPKCKRRWLRCRSTPRKCR